MKAVIGTFDEKAGIKTAVSNLQAAGFTKEEVALVTSYDAEEVRDVLDEEPEHAAASGALVGGGIGSILGLLGGIVVLPIPGAGPLLASGIIASTSTGLLGAYLGSIYATRAVDEPEHELKEALSKDEVLLVVRINEGNEEEARAILSQSGANHLMTHEVDPKVMAELAD